MIYGWVNSNGRRQRIGTRRGMAWGGQVESNFLCYVTIINVAVVVKGNGMHKITVIIRGSALQLANGNTSIWVLAGSCRSSSSSSLVTVSP